MHVCMAESSTSHEMKKKKWKANIEIQYNETSQVFDNWYPNFLN